MKTNLTNNEKLMIFINGIYPFCTSLASIFLNVYLYAYTGSLITMTLFTMCRVVMIPVFFILGGKFSRKWSWPKIVAVGLFLMILELVFVLTIRDGFGTNPSLVYIPALLLGSGEGFFWLGINTLNQLVTTTDSLADYMSRIGMLSNVCNTVAPVVSAILLYFAKDDLTGYEYQFEIVLALYVLLVFLTSKVKVTTKDSDYELWLAITDPDPAWRTCMLTDGIFGIRDALVMTVSGLMLYDAIGDQGVFYSLLTALFALLCILGYRLYQVHIRPQAVTQTYIRSGLLMATSTIVLAFFPNLFGGLYYGISNALLTAPYANGQAILPMREINKYRKTENVTGRVIAKEIPLAIGRVFGMCFILLCHAFLMESVYLKTAVTIISATVVLNMYYLNRQRRTGIIS